MINERSTFKGYGIVSIGLNPSRNWSYDFMTLQLPFFLDINSNKHIAFKIMALLIEKKPSKPSEKPRRKLCVQLVKKLLKLNEKTKKKTKGSINKKPLKLDEETRRKTNYLLLYNIAL